MHGQETPYQYCFATSDDDVDAGNSLGNEVTAQEAGGG